MAGFDKRSLLMGGSPGIAINAQKYVCIARPPGSEPIEQNAPFLGQYDVAHFSSLRFTYCQRSGVGAVVGCVKRNQFAISAAGEQCPHDEAAAIPGKGV